MANRIKFLVQKRTSLKSQITTLANLVDQNRLDNATVKLRIARLTALYNAFEEFNDELMVLDQNDNHQDEFTNVQNRFYSLAGKIETMLNSDASMGSNAGTSSGGSRREDAAAPATRKRRFKLPEAPLPMFDGRYEDWLSFKNAFNNLIGSQTDLTDIDKH